MTDPMESVRQLDLAVAEDGTVVLPSTLVLFLRPSVPDVHPVYQAGVLEYQKRLSRYVFTSTLESSGVGLLCDHIVSAEQLELDGSVRGRRSAREHVMGSMIQPLAGSLSKAAKLASKATVLAVPLIDPDHVGRDHVRRAEAFSASQWGANDWAISQAALDVVAARRLVVDEGHQDITDLTARLRDMAEVHAQGPYFDREQAFRALRETREALSPSGGFVRAGDDRRELLLQVADVASGWARTLIAERGYRALVKVFRCVLYNGVPLTEERAARLDDEISEYRKLVATFAREF